MIQNHQFRKFIEVARFKSTCYSTIQNNDFESIFIKNYVKLTTFQKMLLLVGSPLQFFIVDHKRSDLLACVGELTSNGTLTKILAKMQTHSEGQQILADKPLINTETVRMDFLGTLPENTLGRKYFEFLNKYNLTSDDRLDVKFIDNPEIAYLMTRYRQSHDLVHTIANMPPNKIGEICIKCIEAFSIGIPLCYAATVLGPLLLSKEQLKLYKKYYFPWAVENGARLSFPLLFVYWEKRWEQNITNLRNELGIIPFDKEIIS